MAVTLVVTMVGGLAACVGGPETGGPSDRTAYPAGPYGSAEGAVIADLTFVAPDDSAFSLGALFADPKNRLLLLSTAAGWCTACVEEQPALQALFDEHAARGLRVLVSLFQYADFRPADAALAAAWQAEHGLSVDVVADPDFQLDAYYDSSATPMNMIIDLDTMEIVRITTGWDPTVVESIIEARLP